MINKKSQAGLEFVVMMGIVLIIASIITQNSYLKHTASNALYAYDNAKINCEAIASIITKSMQSEGFESRFYNLNNITIGSGLITLYYDNSVVFCQLPNSTVFNTNISEGWMTVYNNGTSVVVVNS